jgi:hypothetical protein
MVSGERLLQRYGATVLWFGTGYGTRVRWAGYRCTVGVVLRHESYGARVRVVRLVVRYKSTGGPKPVLHRTHKPVHPKKKHKNNQFWIISCFVFNLFVFFFGVRVCGYEGYGFSVSKYGNSAAGSPTNLAMVMARHGEDLLAMLNR